MKSVVLFFIFMSSLYAIQTFPVPQEKGVSSLPMTPAFQLLMLKEPKELDPQVAVIVGAVYCEGSKEMKVQKNQKRCFEYLDFASKNKVALADLIKANQFAKIDDHVGYQDSMEKVMMSGDEQLSIPAGLQLAGYYANEDKLAMSVRVLRYVADVYSDSRAQFMIAYSILNGDYTPVDLSRSDGQFYLYQACTNTNIDPVVEQKCEIYTKGTR
jgi:hypothetical protein